MEENARRDPERPEDSGESNRAILPLLQPPGNQQSHRITNFYIDNILRPDFGRKRKDGTFREGGSLGVITRREELTGRKASKTGNPQQGGAGDEEDDSVASDDQHPDTEARRSDLIDDGDAAVTGRGSDEDRCHSPQASAASAAKPMLWPAWVYCTRYSDRPSSGWWKKIRS